jgi:hypothetical protein
MRVGLTIVLLLQFLGSACVSPVAAGPGAVPTKFSMALNGFMGSADGVVLQNGVPIYTQYARNGTKQQKDITPSPEQWRQFRQALDTINVWRWQPRYLNPGGVADGLRWEIQLTFPDRALHVEGDNNYPDENGRATNVSQQSKSFQSLRAAVQALLGDTSF